VFCLRAGCRPFGILYVVVVVVNVISALMRRDREGIGGGVPLRGADHPKSGR
jgi:hypothetical protein